MYLDGADGWLFSDKCDDAKPEEMELRWDDVLFKDGGDVYGVLHGQA